MASNAELADRADLVVLCHKPHQLDEVAAESARATGRSSPSSRRTRSLERWPPTRRDGRAHHAEHAREVRRGVVSHRRSAGADAPPEASEVRALRTLFGAVVDVPGRPAHGRPPRATMGVTLRRISGPRRRGEGRRRRARGLTAPSRGDASRWSRTPEGTTVAADRASVRRDTLAVRREVTSRRPGLDRPGPGAWSALGRAARAPTTDAVLDACARRDRRPRHRARPDRRLRHGAGRPSTRDPRSSPYILSSSSSRSGSGSATSSWSEAADRLPARRLHAPNRDLPALPPDARPAGLSPIVAIINAAHRRGDRSPAHPWVTPRAPPGAVRSPCWRPWSPLDQATKALVTHAIVARARRRSSSGVELVHVRNHGVAFGAFAGGGVIVAVIIGAALVALVAWFATHSRRPLVWLPTGLLLGGAAGNLVDRARDGAVTTYHPRSGPRSTWPTRRSPSVLEPGAPVLEASGRRGERLATAADAGRRLDAFLAEPLGSRARAQRLIDAGRVTGRRAAAAPEPRMAPGERVVVRSRRRSCRSGRSTARPPMRWSTRTSSCSSSTSRPAWWSTRPPATRPARWSRRWRAARRAARSRGGPGIVHRLDRDTSGLLVVAKRTGPTGRCRRCCARARSGASTWRWSTAARRAHRHHRRADRARPPGPHVPLHEHRPPARGPHPLRARAGAAAHHAAARAPGDRAHPPDPRPPGRDRPSGGRGCAVRRRAGGRPTWAYAPVFAQRKFEVCPSGSRGTSALRVQTARGPASHARSSCAGASLRRARRRLKIEWQGAVFGPPLVIPGLGGRSGSSWLSSPGSDHYPVR